MRMRACLVRLAIMLAVLVLGGVEAKADAIADFYRGKTMHMVVGYGPGGGYDIYGRLAAEFLGRHIPGKPAIIVDNMPGASSIRAVTYMMKLAPQDGTYLASVQQALAMTVAVQNIKNIDPAQLPYIGRLTPNIDIAVALPNAGIKSFDDLRQRQIFVGTDESGSMSVAFAEALNAYAGTKLKTVKGYSGSNEIQLAAERGEIQVNGSYSLPAVLLSHPDRVSKHTALILYQNAFQRAPELPDTPTLIELMRGDEGHEIARILAGTAEIGRSILTTPNVPPERLAALRAAFQAMIKDPDFIAACKQRHLMLDPGTGEAMDAITREVGSISPKVLADLKNLVKK